MRLREIETLASVYLWDEWLLISASVETVLEICHRASLQMDFHTLSSDNGHQRKI